MHGKKPRYNEPRDDEISETTSTVQKLKLQIYPNITNKRQHTTEVGCVTDQHQHLQIRENMCHTCSNMDGSVFE